MLKPSQTNSVFAVGMMLLRRWSQMISDFFALIPHPMDLVASSRANRTLKNGLESFFAEFVVRFEIFGVDFKDENCQVVVSICDCFIVKKCVSVFFDVSKELFVQK